MPPLLDELEHLLARDCGALFEGDVLSILSHSPFVVRAFEFALADAAIDCTQSYQYGSSYAQRLWSVDSRQLDDKTQSRLGLFDIKATLSGIPGSQMFQTSKGQRRRVAFYLCICAADPTFVDLVPNLFQARAALEPKAASTKLPDDDDLLSVTVSRLSRLPPSATGMLDQCNSPCRMPIALLPRAIELVRACLRDPTGNTVYENPWTGARFPAWRPLTTTSTAYLKPSDATAQHTAYFKAMATFQAATFANPGLLDMDMIGLQPRLGDYKLVAEQADGSRRQVIVQEKYDSKIRMPGQELTNVPIARIEKRGEPSFYFTALQRFDFLSYHFDFRDGEQVHAEVFFIPEYEIPDEFYLAIVAEASFELPQFQRYRVTVDQRGDWIHAIHRIVDTTPTPRRAGQRPHRPNQDALTIHPLEQLPTVTRGLERGPNRGRGLYEDLLRSRHHLLFYIIMDLCARRKQGLLVAFATNHPVCDFAYTRYAWDDEEQKQFLLHGQPPKTCQKLTACSSMVPICYYARHAECSFNGPNVSGAQFRRLNSCVQTRLVLWDLFGPDATQPPAPVAVPSSDIAPTTLQRNFFHSDLGRAKGQGQKKGPNVSSLLRTGLLASSYVVNNRGPLVSNWSTWRDLLTLFDYCTLFQPFDHPAGYPRDPSDFRMSLKSIQDRLVQEYYTGRSIEDIEAAENEEKEC